MNLSGTETRQILYCVAEEHRARAAGKPPGVQPWLSRLLQRVELEVAMLSSRQSEQPATSDLDHASDWIGSQQVSRILGWNIWTVQRRANDLDGRKVAGKYVFRESVVRDYAEGLKDGRLAS